MRLRMPHANGREHSCACSLLLYACNLAGVAFRQCPVKSAFALLCNPERLWNGLECCNCGYRTCQVHTCAINHQPITDCQWAQEGGLPWAQHAGHLRRHRYQAANTSMRGCTHPCISMTKTRQNPAALQGQMGERGVDNPSTEPAAASDRPSREQCTSDSSVLYVSARLAWPISRTYRKPQYVPA